VKFGVLVLVLGFRFVLWALSLRVWVWGFRV